MSAPEAIIDGVIEYPEMVMARTEVVSTKFGKYRITSNDILGLTPWLKV